MRWPEGLWPVRMARVAVVAPAGALRDALVRVADAGVVELDPGRRPRAGRNAAADLEPAVLASAPDPGRLGRVEPP
ncbi:hypothetical protein ACFQY7_07910 [Actinomadura luteofluorescens]|uniref:hypothetical protein n=1 Tax=Actinomadura luteofluorescens TaxID=46163 RepID=UPI0036424E75